MNANKCGSFLHIHLGFDADGLEDLPIHAIHVDEWEKGITSERNIAVFSIPSVLDKNMAPEENMFFMDILPQMNLGKFGKT